MTDAKLGTGLKIDNLWRQLHDALDLADEAELPVVAARIAHAIDTLNAVRLQAPTD